MESPEKYQENLLLLKKLNKLTNNGENRYKNYIDINSKKMIIDISFHKKLNSFIVMLSEYSEQKACCYIKKDNGEITKRSAEKEYAEFNWDEKFFMELKDKKDINEKPNSNSSYEYYEKVDW